MTPGTAGPSFPAVVFVDGDDPTLVADGVSDVVGDLLGDTNRELALEDFRADDVDLAAVAESCTTPPFLADRRIVILREVGRFSTEQLAPILAYLEQPLPTTALVLAAGGGTITPRLLSAVRAGGRIVPTKVAPRDTREWVRARLRSAPVRLDAGAERLIEIHLGEDVNRLGVLLEVLTAAYGYGARLDAADVEPYLGEAGSVAPWAFTDAIDAGRTQEALDSLRRLLRGGGRHPLVVLAILHRHVQSLLRLDDPRIESEAEAAAALGIAKGRSTYPARKALASSRRWGSPGIAEAISLVADAELNLKGAGGCPEELVLEVLVARLCRLARAARGDGGRRGSG
jgi:DNA polymerase-3 subunit delta